MGVERGPVVSVCTSVVMSDGEHLFTCSLAICMSSVGKKNLSSVPLPSQDFFFLLLSCILTFYEIHDLQILSPIP